MAPSRAEKLQQLYNKHVFKEETDLYDREQIDFPPFNFTDNQRVIDLLEKRPAGMFLMLDEEENVPPSLRLTAPSSSSVPRFPVSLLLDCKLGTRARKAAPPIFN